MKKILIMFIFAVCLFTGCSTNESSVSPANESVITTIFSKGDDENVKSFDFMLAEKVNSYEFYIEIYENGEWIENKALTGDSNIISDTMTIEVTGEEVIFTVGDQSSKIYLGPKKSSTPIYGKYELEDKIIIEDKVVLSGYYGRDDSEPITYDPSIDLEDFDIDYGIFVTMRLK